MMRTFYHLFSSILAICGPSISFGQTIDQLSSTHDAVLGYHQGYSSANSNYNYADWFGAMSQPGNLGGENNSRSLIAFDLSAYIPGTVINQATLDLYGRGAVGAGTVASVGNVGNNTCWLERVTSPWNDNTVTWNTSPTATSVNAVVLTSSSASSQDYLGVDVTQLVQDMINDPDGSFGFLIRLQIEDPSRGLFFCGRGFTDASKRPRLTIKYGTDISVSERPSLVMLDARPNPCSRGALVDFMDLQEDLTFEMVDGLGRVVIQEGLLHGGTSFMVPITIPEGVYHIRARSRADGRSLYSASLVVLGDQ
ncbi:MAG: DNRLRE domain-containing protein [Flavobacteriales bacterium]|nr:DNRLRE domain-containing protein [Flavobacteriales bacterium]